MLTDLTRQFTRQFTRNFSRQPDHGYYVRRASARWWATGYLRGGQHWLAASNGGGLLHTSRQAATRAVPEIIAAEPATGLADGNLEAVVVRVMVEAADFIDWQLPDAFLAGACRPDREISLVEAWGGGKGAYWADHMLKELARPGSWSRVDRGKAVAAWQRHRQYLRGVVRKYRLLPVVQQLTLFRPSHYAAAINAYVDHLERIARQRGKAHAWFSVFGSVVVVLDHRLSVLREDKAFREAVRPAILAAAGSVAALLLGGDRPLGYARLMLQHGYLPYPTPWLGGLLGSRMLAQPISGLLAATPRRGTWKAVHDAGSLRRLPENAGSTAGGEATNRNRAAPPAGCGLVALPCGFFVSAT